MRNSVVIVAIAAVSYSMIGCGSSSSVTPGETPSTSSSSYSSRLNAGRTISDLNTRDEAMSKLAGDAATAGEADVTRQALLLITDLTRRDDAASQAASKLGKAGKGDEANAIARLITDLNKRDKTLARLAKGE